MGKKVQRRETRPSVPWADVAALFPETQTVLLAEAAGGDWERFFRSYLAGCWREIGLACRAKELSLAEADDVLQELVVRLMKSGQGRQHRDRQRGGTGERGNLPARYLQRRGQGPAQARFRTVLKRVIGNLIMEQLRRQRRAPRLLGDQSGQLEVWVTESVETIVDRQWISACLTRAAQEMLQESRSATTRGKRRWFLILHASVVGQQDAATIANDLGLDRSSVAGLLNQARQRFIAILQQFTGIHSAAELKRQLAAQPEKLIDALAAALTSQ